MLHSLPTILDSLEKNLIQGEDPMPLLASVRWHEIVDWPSNIEDAKLIQRRVSSIKSLISGLQAPIQATLSMRVDGGNYCSAGKLTAPATLSLHFSEQI